MCAVAPVMFICAGVHCVLVRHRGRAFTPTRQMTKTMLSSMLALKYVQWHNARTSSGIPFLRLRVYRY